ncbi:GntR family transcriptional regulator [Escherichia sp. E4736]|uniref:GntR family transcriptional regulator n=1 Tax=Escherichia sp. E4736 TaxID=2044466 RepID=UPI0010803EE5|nr:GntR family transcriptional regulator [Escherichia sp. E4736]TGB63486.1 GntR family transcriptional regulator [Escherichia coli]TLI94152.1 GntR family transcriptional regulator [Escherichia sp. E4736]
MSRSKNLRHNVINQFIDDMARGYIPSPLPSQSALAEMYSVSRTTVRHILSHLHQCGVIILSGNEYVIARKPDHNDGFASTTTLMNEQNKVFEQFFFTMINQRQLLLGETFSELQLARAAGVSSMTARKYISKLWCYNFIQSEKRGQWSMKQFDQSYAEQLFELREMLETHSIKHFLNLPDNDPRWLEAKTMLERHRTLRDNIGSSFRMFSQLDRDFHALLLSATENIFFDHSFEIISVIFHFHLQWDESDLKQRNIIAIDEHMTILCALICRSNLDAIITLRSHLNSAKQSMIRSINKNKRFPH